MVWPNTVRVVRKMSEEMISVVNRVRPRLAVKVFYGSKTKPTDSSGWTQAAVRPAVFPGNWMAQKLKLEGIL